MSSLAVLGLGGNVGDPLQNIRMALIQIENEIGTIEAFSSYYETEAWGLKDQSNFLNVVIGVRTILTADEVLIKGLSIEKELGRNRASAKKWGERPIDIDVLFFDDQIIETPELMLPHPHLINRNFVLIPLCEIYPEMVHPIQKKSIQELCANCNDEGAVKKI